MQSTSQHNSLKTRLTPQLATALRYLIYKQHILTSQSYSCVRALPNATIIYAVMIIITLKTLIGMVNFTLEHNFE